MMRLITILLLMVSSVTMGQKVPDNDEILGATINNASPYFYPALMTRYMAGDTTLTATDYYYLYYGYAFSDNYKPLESIPAADKVLMIFEKDNQPGLDDSRRIIQYALEVMKADPFSPKNINFLIYAYGVLGDAVNERVNADRLKKILTTIENSGTGLKEDSPHHVLWFSHTNDYLASRGLRPMKRVVVSRTTEYVPLMERKDGVKGYYFDFSRVYWRKPESLPEKRVQGLEVNGIKPKKLR